MRAASPTGVVIDTNLILSALVFAQGRLTPLRRARQGGRILPLVCRVTAAELIRALAYPKFKLAPVEQQELLADYPPYCKTVSIPTSPPQTPRCHDAFDVRLLQPALAGKAEALITGEQDFQCLADGFACPIVTAEQFIDTRNP